MHHIKAFQTMEREREKNSKKFFETSVHLSAMMHDTQGTKKQITYTVLHNPSQLIVEYNKNLTEDGDELNFNAILCQC